MKKILFLGAALLFFFGIRAAERELKIETPMCPVYGSLLTPGSPTGTVVLIIAGSGPTDRNGNSPAGINAAPYYLIARELCNAGMASLRYDKRAIGASASPAATNATMRFEYYIDDASAWVDTLRTMGYDKIILAGHSEGSQIAFEVAAMNPNVTAVVSLCGAGEPIDATLRRQLGVQLPLNESVKANIFLDAMLRGERVEEKNIPSVLLPLFPPVIQDYMISWFRYNPAKTIATLRIPILLIGGTTDIQVVSNDLEKLSAACPAAIKVSIAHMNHVLKTCITTDRSTQLETYANPAMPLHEELMPAIIGFVGSL